VTAEGLAAGVAGSEVGVAFISGRGVTVLLVVPLPLELVDAL
jgi:hypothetical protein